MVEEKPERLSHDPQSLGYPCAVAFPASAEKITFPVRTKAALLLESRR
jgi:hypothetical protein